MHFPQNIQTMGELKDLAAIPYMIISPKSGTPIIEAVQDVLVGAYRITGDNTILDNKAVANLQMVNSYFNGELPKKENFTGKEIFSMILPPAMYIENRGLSIIDSEIKKGKLDKKSFKSMSNGLIPVIHHDYGPYEAKRFLDNTQRLICRWFMLDGFSVGISDLVMNNETNEKIKVKIKEKKQQAYEDLDKFRRGEIKNTSISDNETFLESYIINILNEINKEVSSICLAQITDDSNRMINMVRSGSKGKENNVAQMIGCVGQQNFDGKRISYGFTERTLPHFTKYDDGPDARGFVENSFINGLTPQQTFFHAMGGREGLIDTAVKSVTWDTPIIIIENNEPKYVKIGEWIDNHMNKEENKDLIEIFPKEANMELLRLKDYVMIPTCDSKGNVSWEKLTNITRHDPGELLYEVKTRGGRKTIVTASKGLLIWDNMKEEFIETLTTDVKIGDYVPVTMKLEKPPIITEYIDMIKYFPKNNYIYGTDFNDAIELYKNTIDIFGKIPKNWWNNNNNKTFTLPYTLLDRFKRAAISGRSNTENVKRNCIYAYGASREHSHFPDKFKLDYDNGIMVGLYLADGNICVSSGKIFITKKEEGVKTFVKKWFDKFGITHLEKHRVTDRGSITTVEGNSRYFGMFLNEIVGIGSKNKHIPDVAYTAPDEFVIGLLNGYFSGDGSVSDNSITVTSISERLIEGITYLCSRLGIFGYTHYSKSEKNNLGTVNIAPIYTLTIRSLWAKRFQDKIKLINNDKNEKLKIMTSSKNHINFPYVNDVVKDEIIEINIIPNEVVIEKYPKMYDVTVPSTLNFMIANGLVSRDTSDTGLIFLTIMVT